MKLHEQVKVLKERLAKTEDSMQAYRAFLWGPKFAGIDTDGASKDWIRTGEVTSAIGDWIAILQDAIRSVEIESRNP